MASIDFTLRDDSIHGELGAALDSDPLNLGSAAGGAVKALALVALGVLPESVHGFTAVHVDTDGGKLTLTVDTTIPADLADTPPQAEKELAPPATAEELKRSAATPAPGAPATVMFGTNGPINVPAAPSPDVTFTNPVPVAEPTFTTVPGPTQGVVANITPAAEPQPSPSDPVIGVTDPTDPAHDEAVTAAQDSAAIAAEAAPPVAELIVAQALDDVNKALEQWPESEALKGAKVELEQFAPIGTDAPEPPSA